MGVTIHMLMISFFCCFCYINKTKEPKPQNFLEKFWFEAQTCFLLGRVFSVFPKAKTLAFLKTSSLGVMQGAKNPSIFLKFYLCNNTYCRTKPEKNTCFFSMGSRKNFFRKKCVTKRFWVVFDDSTPTQKLQKLSRTTKKTSLGLKSLTCDYPHGSFSGLECPQLGSSPGAF